MGSPERKHLKNVLNLSHSTTQTVVFFRVKTDRNKFAQYKLNSRHYKWLSLITEIFKKILGHQFPKYARAYLRKGRTPLRRRVEKDKTDKRQKILFY